MIGVLRSFGAAALIAALAVCTSPLAAGGASPPSSGAATVVKIGIDLPLSGADASDGQPIANGAILAVEDANAHGFAGGKYKLEADVLDDAVQGKHDPAAGAQNAKTFINDRAVLAMIGPFNSNVAQAQIPLTNDAGLVQISPGTTNDTLTIGPAAKKLRATHPDTITFFRVCTRDSKQGAALATFARQKSWRRAYVIDDNETYGKGLADVFDADFRGEGGIILGHDHVTANQQDFKALLTKAKASRPDVIFFGGLTSTGGGLIRRQMADVGMGKMPFLGGDGISGAEFVKLAGDEANGVYYSFAAPDVTRLPAARAFVEAYKKRFGVEVGPYSANGYVATQIAISAIGKALAGSHGALPSRSAVLENVRATRDFDSPIGRIGFDASGDTTRPILTLKEIERGQAVTVDQIAVSQ